MARDAVGVKEAFSTLADMLEGVDTQVERNPITGMSFPDFFFNVYALSFPDYDFDTWHLRVLCQDVQNAFDTGRGLVFVLPRYHLKSTTLYAVLIWRMHQVRNCSSLYLSYKDGMAKYHLEEIKRIVRENPILPRYMNDLTKRSIASCRYAIMGLGTAKILSGGILSFKRGTHVNGCCICDDILRDPQNPLNLSQLLMVEKHVRAEIANIPNRGVPLLVAGTPMHAQDILFKLKDDAEFTCRFLPAIRPTDDNELYGTEEVLWAKQFDKKWLENKSKSDWRSFQTEFLLTPAWEIAAFFTHEELEPVLYPLHNHSLDLPLKLEDDEEECFAGYDVGKKRHPSHLAVIIRKKDGRLIMIHQSFWDMTDYEVQKDNIIKAVENFNIRRLIVDNTRAEMDERGLPPQCVLVSMHSKMLGSRQKVRVEAATSFSTHVSHKDVELIDDVRFVSQIIAVGADLECPESPMGHGESFWSVGLALLAHDQIHGTGGLVVGDMSFLANGAVGLPAGPVVIDGSWSCPSCGGRGLTFRFAGENVLNPREANEAYCLECRQGFSLSVVKEAS